MRISSKATLSLLALLQTANAFSFTACDKNSVGFHAASHWGLRMSDVDDAITESTEDKVEKEEEGFKIYVGNLPFETTPREIGEMFREYGTILNMNVPKDRNTGNRRGFAFISMSTQEAADAAIAGLHQKEINGRNINVNMSLPVGEAPPNRRKVFVPRTKIYVGNLPFEADQNDLADLFREYGEVHDSYTPIDVETNLRRGFGFVTMDVEDANNAIENMDGFIFQNRELIVNESIPKGSKPAPRREFAVNDDMKRLYVGNLSFDADEEILMDLFSDFGEVKEIYFPTWPDTGRPKGFAFVTLDKEAADAAIEETDGFEFLGRNIQVNEAVRK